MQDDLLVRSLMTKINKLGNDIKKLQKAESKKSLERHCKSLNSEVNAKKFFDTFAKIAEPIANPEPSSQPRPLQDEFGNKAILNSEKAILFGNRLQRIHQEPDFEAFDDGWKASVERFLEQNNRSYKVNMNDNYRREEFGDDLYLCHSVTIEELDGCLARCKNRSAVGHDGISYSLLKRLPKESKQSLCQIYSDAFRIGHFPKIWKSAIVKMIPKPNKDIKYAKNFRPISLLSCVGKVLERLLATRLSKYMEEKKLFTQSQSGFRRHHMTTEQLLRLAEESYCAFKKKQISTALFLDAEAAFDRCWHNGIRFKLKENLNLPDRTIRLISSFLSERTLRVMYEGCMSHEVFLNAGTPQGSPLSPLIYIIYVNDYPESIQENCSLSVYRRHGTMDDYIHSRQSHQKPARLSQ